jgi:hypothetical protein
MGHGNAATKKKRRQYVQMSRVFLLLAGIGVGLLAQPGLAQEQPDRLAEVLDEVGFSRADLGCKPKAYWARFPSIRHIPHLLPFFEDLFAEPLRTYEFSRVMAGAVEEYLSPTYRAKHDNGMFKVAYFLGIGKKVVGPRGFSANVVEFGAGPDPVVRAMERLYAVAGRTLDTRTGGGEAIWPQRRKELMKQLQQVPPALHEPFATLLYQIADVWAWRQLAVARLAAEDMQAVFYNRSLHDTQLDGQEYFPEMDRVADLIDEVSLYHAAQKAVQSVETASRAFRAILDSTGIEPRSLSFEFLTPIGRVVLSGTGDDHHACDDCAVLVDLGGNDTYEGAVGSTPSLVVPVSVAIDMSGDDQYQTTSWTTPSQGAGILGVGVLLDRAGKDRYEAGVFAQGAGLFGFGLLWDEAGDDDYKVQYGGQGAGYFGIGLLVDGNGSDHYYLWGDGQGFGGVGGGVGTLADVSGDDRYIAEVDAHIAGRGDYHTHMRVPNSNAQGAGMGRRGDISDGHAWAGGLGTLVDLEGNDTYESGNWAAGCGYWFGTGILYDGGGDDLYQSVYFSMASGAHFSIGAIFDEAGDDQYRMIDAPVADDLVPQGQGMDAWGGGGLAFGWDFTMALLVDKGGDDYYQARINAGAQADIRSTAILADLGGSDQYVFPRSGGGNARFMKGYADNVPPFQIEYGPYSHYGTNFGFLLDTGGEDQYFEWGENGQHTPSAMWKDGHTWRQPDPADEHYGHNSYGIGMDVEGGTIPEFHVFEPQ